MSAKQNIGLAAYIKASWLDFGARFVILAPRPSITAQRFPCGTKFAAAIGARSEAAALVPYFRQTGIPFITSIHMGALVA
ncbi:MAG: hypothetical protein H0X43_01250 [Nitrosospira sp.]|nr:hypothetical protein [Nitrosospira sp.]